MAINWKRIVTVAAGAAPLVYDIAQGVPGWGGVVGAALATLAINAERFFARREKGSPTFDTREAQTKVDKMRMVIPFIAALGALSVNGCQTDTHIPQDSIGQAFKKMVGHDAVTVSEKQTIYLTGTPPSAQLVCHEEAHKAQAKVLADALVVIGAIDDDADQRMAVWLALYGIQYGAYGYKNRFELEAQKLCPPDPGTDAGATDAEEKTDVQSFDWRRHRRGRGLHSGAYARSSRSRCSAGPRFQERVDTCRRAEGGHAAGSRGTYQEG